MLFQTFLQVDLPFCISTFAAPVGGGGGHVSASIDLYAVGWLLLLHYGHHHLSAPLEQHKQIIISVHCHRRCCCFINSFLLVQFSFAIFATSSLARDI